MTEGGTSRRAPADKQDAAHEAAARIHGFLGGREIPPSHEDASRADRATPAHPKEARCLGLCGSMAPKNTDFARKGEVCPPSTKEHPSVPRRDSRSKESYSEHLGSNIWDL